MILTIFKTIGIIILVILFLIILILAVALLSPIKYMFNVKYYDDPDVLAVVKYAPVGLNAKVTFKEDTLKYTVKALGGVIMTNTDEKLSWLGKKISGAYEPDVNAVDLDSANADDKQGDIISNDDNVTTEVDKKKNNKTKRLKTTKDKRPFSEKIAEKAEHIKKKLSEILYKLKKLPLNKLTEVAYKVMNIVIELKLII